MAAFLVIGRRRVRLRFFVFVAMLLFCGIYLFLSSRPEAAFAAISYGRLDVVHSGMAVIIREETVYTAPVYGKAVYLAADGTAVEAGQPVAVLYNENFDEDAVKQLYDVQEKIVEYQQDHLLDQVIDIDLSNLNSDINSLLTGIQTCVKDKKYAELVKMENQLRKLLENKQKLLDYRTEPDAYLSSLYDKEASLMAKINEWMVQVEAREAGLVSFSIDGFENILGISAVDKLTKEDLQQFIEQPSAVQQTASAEAEQPFYRITNPLGKWYAVMLCQESETYLHRGDTIQAVFDGQEPLSATVSKIYKDNGQSIITLEFSAHVEKVLNKRVTPLQLEMNVEGLMIPESALKDNKGIQGVFVRDGDKNIFIETTVKAAANGYAIVESVSDNQILKLNDQVLIDN
ncbi:MAG TPA: hypothetical protein GX505_11310 [Clostridiales bacterium]|nr:hypothetical protein [Clostridiales bacterium]